MAKFLPCKKCGTALGPNTTKYPNGEPLLIGRLSTNPLIYKCHRCKMPYILSSAEYNKLPTASSDVLAKMGYLT